MPDFLKMLQINSPVFLDTACFIYTFEEHPKYSSLTKEVFAALSNNKLVAFSSIITVSEVLTKPFEKKRADLAEKYQEAFELLPNFTILSPDYNTAIAASQVRAKYKFRLLDSLQLTMAREGKCRSFITNDKQLTKFKELKVVYLEDLV